MTDPETLLLAADFPPATQEEWRKLVDAVLKGAPFARLISTTYDGLSIAPLAQRRAEARPVAARPGAAPWEVLARVDHPDPALGNEIALRELNNGATGLALVIAGAVGDYGFGLPESEQALGRVLEGFDFNAGATLELELSPHAAAAVDAMLAKGFAQSQHGVGVRIGHDPIGAIGGEWTRGTAMEPRGAAFCPPPRRPRPRRLPRQARGRRRPHYPQCRRLRGAGTGLCAQRRACLLARA